jgi:hypothetical protein
MNNEPNPNAQMPAGNARQAAAVLLEDTELVEGGKSMCVVSRLATCRGPRFVTQPEIRIRRLLVCIISLPNSRGHSTELATAAQKSQSLALN